jgi:hypothetical protein
MTDIPFMVYFWWAGVFFIGLFACYFCFLAGGLFGTLLFFAGDFQFQLNDFTYCVEGFTFRAELVLIFL